MKLGARETLIAAVIVGVAWVGCRLVQEDLSSGEAAAAQPPAGAREAAPQGWSAREDPMGFLVNVPEGWTVHGDRSSGRVELRGTAGERAVVWPVFSPPDGRPGGRGVSFQPATGAAVLERLAAKLWPTASWQDTEPVSSTAVLRRGRSGDRIVMVVFTWVASSRGSAGQFYGVSAPKGRYREIEETAACIFESFRMAGAPVHKEAAPPAVRYVKWVDPRENAFSLDVPAEWNVSGGLFRFASVDVRPAIEAVSPDEQIRIASGDSGLPPFAVPNQMLLMAGFGEGSWYSPGYGVRMMVRRYVPGTAFAAEYANEVVSRVCAGVNLTGTRDRPDAVAAINRINAQYGAYGIATELTAGEVTFTCTSDGRPMEGYYFAATQVVGSSGVAQWSAPHLYGFVATAGRAALARSVLGRMIQSSRINPQWAAMQQNVTAETSRIVAQTNQEITKIITETYEARQASDDGLARRRSNATLGLEDVIDPTTGEQLKIESGSEYYWIDNLGNIVGTQTHTTPHIDFREMIRLP